MRARLPIWFVYGNCVYGEGPDDAWAAFNVQTASYAWLSRERKRTRMLDLLAAIEAVEADIQLLRVNRLLHKDDAMRGDPIRRGDGRGRIPAPPSGAQRARRREYEAAEARRLRERGSSRPELFLLVSLRDPERDVASHLASLAESRPRDWASRLRGALLSGGRRLLAAQELEHTRVRADRVHDRIAAYLPARPARGVELQWLVRRSFCRGLGEPEVEGLHEPRALAFERNGEAVLAPLEADVLRWMNCVVERRGRLLRLESELGESWQAHLVMGALPETVAFPGAGAELMFAPVESLPS